MNLSNPFVAVLDTCVLAPMPLADTLLRLAEEPAFYTPQWSSGTIEELRRVLIRRWRHTEGQAAYRIGAMLRAFPGATVTGYEELQAAMTNAPEDRHVLAAAVRCGASAIVTSNLRDFPASALAPYDVQAMSPDTFLVHQFFLSPPRFASRLADQARAAGFAWDALLLRLERHAPECVQLLRQRDSAS